MDELRFLTTLRLSERLLVDLGGIIAIVLGTLLFRWGVAGNASLVVNAQRTKLRLVNAAPGTLLALFGCALLSLSFVKPITYYSGQGEKRVTYSGSVSEDVQSLLKRLMLVDTNDDTASKLAVFKADAEALYRKLFVVSPP
jgi:hypothetical protein